MEVVIVLYLVYRLEVKSLSRHRRWGASPFEGGSMVPCSLGAEETTMVYPPSRISP